MSCPTCDYTMSCLHAAGGAAIYHCGRCGTVKASDPPREGEPEEADVLVPELVAKCRQFQGEFDKENIAQFYRNTWHRLGIVESINVPENRPVPTKSQEGELFWDIKAAFFGE